MIEKPPARQNGLPICHHQIMYMLDQAGGVMTRGEIRKQLIEMGYSYYCIYEAYRRLELRNIVRFEGSGHSPYQKLILTSKSEQEFFSKTVKNHKNNA